MSNMTANNGTGTSQEFDLDYVELFMSIVGAFGILSHFLGAFGNLISARAFYLQIHQDGAYWHQITIIVNDMITIVTGYIGVFSLIIYGWKSPAETTISGILRVVGYPLAGVAYTATTILVCGVTRDRVVALQNPQAYKSNLGKYNHKKNAVKLAVVSWGLALLLHSSRLVRVYLAEFQNPKYHEYIGSSSSFYLDSAAGAFETIALAYIVYLMVKLARMYRVLQRKRRNIVNSRNSGSNSANDNTPIHERSLTVLLLAQLVLLTLGLGTRTSFAIVGNLANVLDSPILEFWAVILNPFVLLFSTFQVDLNFLIYVILSKKFRRAVKKVVCCCDNAQMGGAANTTGV